MGTTNKKLFVLICLIIGFVSIIWWVNQYSKPTEHLKFVPIQPSEVYRNRDTDSLQYRQDFFAIMNLSRSDSAALLSEVAKHACQVTDTINLKKYSNYRIEYYEYGRYMNESTLQRVDDELWHVADEIDAFVYWIIYHEGELSIIRWSKNGMLKNKKEIVVTKEIKLLFKKCHKLE